MVTGDEQRESWMKCEGEYAGGVPLLGMDDMKVFVKEALVVWLCEESPYTYGHVCA